MKASAAGRKSHSDIWCWELYWGRGGNKQESRKGAGVEGEASDHAATKRNAQQAMTSA